MKKGYFPHLYNTAANIDVDPLPHLPAKDAYGYRSMKLEDRPAFNSWYEEHKGTEFNLKLELPAYGMTDVNLMAEGLIKYRALIMDKCKFDCLASCSTLASSCMRHYRMNILKPKTIGINGELSYERHDRQSSIGIKMLHWLQHCHPEIEVQHYASLTGEKRLTLPNGKNVQLDGFVAGGWDKTSNDLAIEING